MTQAPRNTKALTQGAMFAALTVMMVLVGVVFPPLQLFFLFLPVPIAIATLASGLNVGIMTGIVTGFLAGLVARSPLTVVTVTASGALGIAIGYALEQRFPATKGLAISFVFTAIMVAVNFAIDVIVLGLEGMVSLWAKNWQPLYKIAAERPEFFNAANAAAAKTVVDLQLKYLVMVLPGFMLAFVGIFGGVMYILSRSTGKRLGFAVGEGFPPFREWRFPRILAWVFLLSATVALAAFTPKGATIGVVVSSMPVFLNVAVFCGIVFMVQGLAVLWYLYDLFGVDGLGRFVVTFIIYVTGLIVFMPLVGMADTFLDYRRPREGAA